MAREKFIRHKFTAARLAEIEKANAIIAEYQAQGFTLTLRQLYYQFVARGLIANKQSEYKRLGEAINVARLAGLVDWDAIEDRTRTLRRLAHWSEVWIEKDALLGVIEPVCNRWRLPYFACRGYASQSAHYEAGKRMLRDAAARRRRALVLHLGDHDPSGIDMTRDNADRLEMFSGGCGTVDVNRLALNQDQVEQYNPPPNPAKETDSRAGSYIAEYGESSWELDALDPRVIDELIEREVRRVIDMKKWRAAKKREDEGRKRIEKAARALA